MKTATFRFAACPRLLVLLCGMLLALGAACPSLNAAGRVALFIGNNDYRFARKLKNPVNDATGLEARLRAAGFRTFQASDATVEDMTARLELFYEAARDAEIALFFYAGHGLESGGKNYLLPVDARLELGESLTGEALAAAKRALLKREAVHLADILDDLGDTGAKLKLVVLDCCRDDPLPQRSWLSRGAGGGGALAPVSEKDLAEGTMLVFSTEPGKTASDGDAGGHSPFTGAVIESLAPGASILGVFTGAAGRMSRQEPWIKFDGSGKAMLGFGSLALIPAGTGPVSSAPVSPAPMPAAGLSPGMATKERPHVNGLGMKFVPVPIGNGPSAGKTVLFSIWETRVRDYTAYAAANPGVDMEWKDYEFKGHGQGPDHPVVNVSWEDAKAFCAWLTKTERASGKIGAGDAYRLPTDVEWSWAVGIGDRESAGATPKEKGGAIEVVYPWGTAWPPPDRVGNYADSEVKRAFDFDMIEGYDDGYAFTAPVGSYGANALGLHDLGGNVGEWCEDSYDGSSAGARVLRGASWRNGLSPGLLLSSYRDYGTPDYRSCSYGFRCVLAVGVAR